MKESVAVVEATYATCGAMGRKGTPCKRPAGWGTQHVGDGRCKLHGGNTATHRTAAVRTMIQTEMLGTTLGAHLAVDIHPTEALLELVKMTAGYVRWLNAEVAALGRLEESSYVTGLHEPKVLIRLLGEYTDRLARFSKMALDAGVEERLVSLAEAQGELVASVLVNVLSDLALSPAQQAAAPEVVRRHMLVLEGRVIEEA